MLTARSPRLGDSARQCHSVAPQPAASRTSAATDRLWSLLGYDDENVARCFGLELARLVLDARFCHPAIRNRKETHPAIADRAIKATRYNGAILQR